MSFRFGAKLVEVSVGVVYTYSDFFIVPFFGCFKYNRFSKKLSLFFKVYPPKKRLSIYPSPAGMSLTKHSLARNN